MRLPFLRKADTGGEPLVVAMTGVRLGESVLFWGRSAAWAVPLAAKTGLSGRCVICGPPETTGPIESAASREGVLVEVSTAAPDVPGFDLAVVEAVDGWEAAARDFRNATRPGGRVIVVIGAPPRGLLGRLTSSPTSGAPSAESVASALSRLGWQRVRPIGDRDGVSFVEGFAS
jgi:hypothetical protein